ncbi:MAG: hypothetical protein M3069_22455 [Chloroflexota bacterium]|nr:hypothetical protein [Chloroflexota bacterium]
MTVRPSTAEDRPAAPELNEIDPGDNRRRTPRAFEVTVVTIRSGTTAVVITAVDREAAASTVREQLASGEYTAPPEHCTDDIQTEIWTIRELH